MPRFLTNAQLLALEGHPNTSSDTRFLLNWCRHQHSNRVARAAASLVQAGRSVVPVSVPDGPMGFRLDGDFVTALELCGQAGCWR